MDDKLISTFCRIVRNQSVMPIGMMLGGNPFTDPRLNDFRQEAIGIKDDNAYFVLQESYDTDKKEYKIPTDLYLFLLSELEINSLLNRESANPDFAQSDYMER